MWTVMYLGLFLLSWIANEIALVSLTYKEWFVEFNSSPCAIPYMKLIGKKFVTDASFISIKPHTCHISVAPGFQNV